MDKKALEKRIKKTGGITARFDIVKNSFDKDVNKLVFNFKKKIEKDLYQKLSTRYLSSQDIDKIMQDVDFQIAEITEKIRGGVRSISGAYTDVELETEKVKTALNDYFSRDYAKDMAGAMLSVKDQYESALNQIQLVVNTQAKKDFRILTESIKKYENKDLKDNFDSFIKVFKNDYGAQYLDEMMKNPTLSKMIKQEDGELFFYAKNGKRYNLEDYVNQRAEWTTTDITRKTAEQFAKESGTEVYRFQRIKDAKEPREHSVYEGRLFSFTSKENDVLDGNTISDFPLGGQAPYGCGHAYIPVGFGEKE